MDIIFTGATVIDPSQAINGRFDILVRNGQVAAIAQNIPQENRQVIHVAGKTVIPGLIDLHTHLREPGGEAKETIASGSRAAAAGGYTSITALPNTNPVLDNSEMIANANAIVLRDSVVRVFPVGAATVGSAGQKVTAMGEMVKLGVRAVTDDGRGIQNARILRAVLLCCKEYDLPLFEHCEDESLAGKGQLHDGSVAARLGLPGIPPSAEDVMLARDLGLAAETGARLHVMHVSTAVSVEMIRQAKAKGILVTAEVTPHHLLLTEDAVEQYHTMAKMKPPLRTAADMMALRQGLADGTLDAVATDHAPHTAAEKTGDFITAAFGIVGLETAFPLLYTHLVKPSHISLATLVKRMSWAPASILKVPFGTLKVGSAADLTVIDTEQEYGIDRDTFHSKGKNTPFHGWSVFGAPLLTMVGGDIVMHAGRIEKKQ